MGRNKGLKLCNTNIHTYTSHFMDIQQQKWNPLQHTFKTEERRCNFTNDATTIKSFVKGLKNAHSLAMHIYKKGPQMLTDATTHHIDHTANHPCIEALQVIDPEITVGHIHDYPTDLQGMNHIDQVHNPAGQEENHIPRT